MTGIPKQVMVSYQEVAEALDKSIFKIEEAILKALETTPPELAADIYRRGLYLTGGGALLRGLDKRLEPENQIARSCCRRSAEKRGKRYGNCIKELRQVSFCDALRIRYS